MLLRREVQQLTMSGRRENVKLKLSSMRLDRYQGVVKAAAVQVLSVSSCLFLASTVDANDDVCLFGCIEEDGGADAVKSFSGRWLPSGHIECLGRKDSQQQLSCENG